MIKWDLVPKGHAVWSFGLKFAKSHNFSFF
jgi:hypothetical protein